MAEKKKKMQTCECRVQVDSRTTVLRRNITPAEALVLTEMNGAQAIIEPVQKTSVERTPIEEKQNLVAKYDRGNRRPVETLFPGHAPNLPMTFEEAGIAVQLAPTKKTQKGNIKAVKDGDAGELTEKEKKEIGEAESVVTATS